MQRLITLLVILCSLPATGAEPLRIAVAANFRSTLNTINSQYTQHTGQRILLSSASSGALATQIMHGAPFDLFLSADRAAPDTLVQNGKAMQARCYARGSLVLVGGNLKSLSTPARSLAIGNPATAPYGQAAMAVLARPEYDVERTLVRGTNVLQAYQFWLAGAVDLALVARALAPDGVAVPASWHPPLEQHLVLLRDSPAARAYLQWLGSDTVRQMIKDAGYLTCS